MVLVLGGNSEHVVKVLRKISLFGMDDCSRSKQMPKTDQITRDYSTYTYAPSSELPSNLSTICPRSSDPFYIVSYYIKWVTTSWTHSTMA